MSRDTMIAVVNLSRELNLEENTDTRNDWLIITDSNNFTMAFHVHNTIAFHGIFWSDIHNPDNTEDLNESGIAAGITKIKDKVITIPDMDKNITGINQEIILRPSALIIL